MKMASTEISLQEIEQKDSTARTIYQVDREARSTQALARVSAGEAGVSGSSVEALLGDIDRKRGEVTVAEGRNLGMILSQLDREKISGRTIAQSRIANVPKASTAATALNIGGQFLGFWAGQIGRSAIKTDGGTTREQEDIDKIRAGQPWL
jgi:hypothetical protein